jgi:arsenate reductase
LPRYPLREAGPDLSWQDGAMTVIYHNPRCTTSRKALAKLEESNTAYEVVLYLKAPPGRQAIIDMLSRLEDPPSELVRHDKRFKDLGLTPADYVTVSAVADLLVAHPELMQRPVIDDGVRAFIGRPLDRVDAFTDS